MAELHSFNPLPLPKQGETTICSLTSRPGLVSIRSPYRSKGRPGRAGTRPRRDEFQSAPLTEARGDTSYQSDLIPFSVFQSAPLTEARGDGASAVMRCAWPRFQSAPLTEARGDVCPAAKPPCRSSFNPLPLPKQGETLAAITSGITKTYTGKCAIRSDSCQECLTRLTRNAITCCNAGSFQLRESKHKTPSLHFRARYKTSGSFKSTGSPTP